MVFQNILCTSDNSVTARPVGKCCTAAPKLHGKIFDEIFVGKTEFFHRN